MNSVRGTRDYLPKDMIKIERLMEKIKENFRKFGFEPMDTPRLEPYELFKKKIGEGEKDIFKFKDKGGREIALRFEQTASLKRVFENYSIPLPFKRYSIGKVWRYEEPQKGRYREFWQADIDTIGVESPAADAEVIACMYKIFSDIGLKVKVSINDREIADEILEKYNVKEKIGFLRIIDKRDKIGDEGVKEMLKEKGYDLNIYKEILESKPNDRVKELMKFLDYYGVNYEFDPTIVRGLDYYTSLVYEIVSPIGTLAGGGRYDRSIRVGDKFVPACGMSIGINRVYDMISDKVDGTNFTDYLVCWVGDFEKALKVAIKLRKKSNVDLFLLKRSLSKQLEYASKKNIRKVVIVGREEKVTIKDLKTGEQRKVDVDEI